MSTSSLVMAVSLARDLGPFLSSPVTFEEARARVRVQLEEREANFLRFTERAIYGQAASPYRALLRAAACELGDLEALVRQDGLDTALATLRDAGVYVTFGEFKGRTPIVRGRLELPVSESAFDNPLVNAQYARCGREAPAASAAWSSSISAISRPGRRIAR